MGGDEPDLDDPRSIFSTIEYALEAPKRKEFLPWHRPRKQWVRAEQWATQIERLAQDHHPDDGPLRYLGLPGPDLLDLRYLHERLALSQGIHFLGFMTSGQDDQAIQTELNTSLHEVLRLEGIDQRSDVVGDDVRRLASGTSMAWKRAREAGPFDVVNLDLCDNMLTDVPATVSEELYTAIARLFTLQERRHGAWLLLLTTRVGTDGVDHQVLQTLDTLISQNIEVCESFRDAYAEHLCSVGDASTRITTSPSSSAAGMIVTAICKWLMQLSQTSVRCELKSCASYRVYGAQEYDDLVSLAIRFTPILEEPVDTTGLASGSVSTATARECEQAARIPRRVANAVRVDQLLKEDPEQRQELETVTASLLEQARYDPEEYFAWLAQQPA